MHIIFDRVGPYPEHIDQAKQLRLLLEQAYTNKDDIDTFYRGCGVYLTELPAIDKINPTSTSLWKVILNNLSEKGKLQRFCEIVEQSGPVPQVLAAITALRNVIPSIDTTVINTDMLVLDRQNLRDYLLLIANEKSMVKVLVVRGEEKSGKTYSRYLFDSLAQQLGYVPTYLFRSVVVTLDNALDPLFTAAGDINAKPPGNTTENGWYSTVCNKLLDTAIKNNKYVWVVVDDLSTIENTDSIMVSVVRDFFNQFVSHMSSAQFRKYFRLMLINYPPGKLPTGWDKTILKQETLSKGDITQKHIEELVNNYCNSTGKKVVEFNLETEAARIISESDNHPTDPDDLSKLEWIHEQVSQLISGIK